MNREEARDALVAKLEDQFAGLFDTAPTLVELRMLAGELLDALPPDPVYVAVREVLSRADAAGLYDRNSRVLTELDTSIDNLRRTLNDSICNYWGECTLPAGHSGVHKDESSNAISPILPTLSDEEDLKERLKQADRDLAAGRASSLDTLIAELDDTPTPITDEMVEVAEDAYLKRVLVPGTKSDYMIVHDMRAALDAALNRFGSQ